MHRRTAAFLLTAWFSLLGCWWVCVSPAAVAQQPTTTITIVDPQEEILDLLRRGHQLELQRRWGEALTHYEDALRRYPDDAGLRRRFERVRMHYDLTRRSIWSRKAPTSWKWPSKSLFFFNIICPRPTLRRSTPCAMSCVGS